MDSSLFYIFLMCFSFFHIINAESLSQYITEQSDLNKLLPLLSPSQLSLILIFSPYCPHCKNFAPHYNKLAETYHDKITFFRMNGAENRSYNKKFNIRGYPSLWIYYNDTYQEVDDVYTFDNLSKKLLKEFLFTCESISYPQYIEYLSSNYMETQSINSNFIVNFNTSNQELFTSITKQYSYYIEKCFICNSEIPETSFLEGAIVSFAKHRGVNTFTQLKHTNEPTQSLIFDLNEFIRKYTLNMFIHINSEAETYEMYNLKRDSIILSYAGEKQKNEYIQFLSNCTLLNKYQIKLVFDFVLFNMDNNIPYLSRFSFKRAPGMYFVKKGLKEIVEIKNFTFIEELIINTTNLNENIPNTNNNYGNKTDDAQKSALGSYLNITLEKENEEKIQLKYWAIRKILLGLISLVLYTLVFTFIIEKIKNKNKLKKEATKTSKTVENEEIKKLKEVI